MEPSYPTLGRREVVVPMTGRLDYNRAILGTGSTGRTATARRLAAHEEGSNHAHAMTGHDHDHVRGTMHSAQLAPARGGASIACL